MKPLLYFVVNLEIWVISHGYLVTFPPNFANGFPLNYISDLNYYPLQVSEMQDADFQLSKLIFIKIIVMINSKCHCLHLTVNLYFSSYVNRKWPRTGRNLCKTVM